MWGCRLKRGGGFVFLTTAALPAGGPPGRVIGYTNSHITTTADCGDYVVAVGCAYLKTTGDKRTLKKYYSHSTRPGSLKEITMDRMITKYGGAEVLRRAVRGMLPKNRLRDIRLERLKGASFIRVWGGVEVMVVLLIGLREQHSKASAIHTRRTWSASTTQHIRPRHQSPMRSRASC